MTDQHEPLADACEVWQSGRDGGSTPLRAGARVLSGVPHYFSAAFIDDLDQAARRDPVCLERARTLLDAVAAADQLEVDDWRVVSGVPGSGPASRGIAPKSGIDEQIHRLVTTPGNVLRMPLWGFSLSAEVAQSFGGRFLFRLTGRFSALPAWIHSGIKADEQEMIGGGDYRVNGTHQDGQTLVVDLEQVGLIRPL